MHAIVLAGGRGTRLGHLTREVPKPMVPVAGRPFLEFVLDRLVDSGFRRITLSVGYLAQVVQDHFGFVFRGADLRYAVEHAPLGTGGAIRHALQDRGEEAALVVNGDTLLQADFGAIARWYEQEPVPAAIVLRRMDDVGRYGAVALEGDRVTAFLEKGREGPGLINAGVYVVTPALFEMLDLPRVFSFETDVLQRHCATLRPRGLVSDAWFIDIGIPADLERARLELPAPA
jgi:D-glycero-alpha-D-manno-heptose 1-phosphate guanylyltransferase